MINIKWIIVMSSSKTQSEFMYINHNSESIWIDVAIWIGMALHVTGDIQELHRQMKSHTNDKYELNYRHIIP